MEVISAILDVLKQGGTEFLEILNAALHAIGDLFRFLEAHGLDKTILNAIFELVLKIFGAA